MANLDQIAMLSALDGILLVDKPAGASSHDIVKDIKRRFNLVKVGHGGTLDPNATGLLIILVGNGTKLSDSLMGGDKAYTATMRLGVSTNTQDKEGQVLASKPFDGVTREAFDKVLCDFRGDIFQVPPMFSAIKMHGRPLYDIARTGDEVDRQPRFIHIYRMDVTDFAPPLVTFSVVCTKGTYIRTLANDIGDKLGCGASLESLRRTACGRYRVADATPFDTLMDMPPMDFMKRVIPMTRAVEH